MTREVGLAVGPSAEELRVINERLVLSAVREQELADAAQRQHAEFRAVLEALGEGVVIAASNGRVLMVNAAGRTLAGFGATDEPTLADVEALDLRSLDGAALGRERRPLRRALRGEGFTHEEALLVGSGGEAGGPRRVEMSGTRVVVSGGVTLAIVVLRDVTERRELEARLVQAERLATLGTLTAGVAHEVNNPLTYVLGNIDLALEALEQAQSEIHADRGGGLSRVGSKLAEAVHALGEVQEGSLRIHRLVRSLGRVGRIDEAERSAVSLTDILDDALRFTERRVRLCASVRRAYQPTPMVHANSDELAQVFVNLLVNASQAIGEGAADTNEIGVATYGDSAGRAVVEVRDSGRGIPAAALSRIFDPFFTTKAVGEGMGLGLSISQSIVRSLGGELSAESNVGVGTTFRLVLPAAAPPVPVSVRVTATPRDAGRARVMVLDDDDAVARSLCRMLDREHEVVVFTDAREALSRVLAGEGFDVILCDLMMPVMTGMEFYETLRDTSPDVARRVVLVTGGAFSERAAEFLRSFPNPVVSKPVDRTALRTLVADYVKVGR